MKIFLAITGAVLLSIASAQGATITHNGLPPSGTGEVDVYTEFGVLTDGAAIDPFRQYFEMASHDITVEDPAETIDWVEVNINSTGSVWTEFRITLFGADFLNLPEIEPMNSGLIELLLPIVGIPPRPNEITIATSSLLRQDGNAYLTIVFDDPVDPGEIFALHAPALNPMYISISNPNGSFVVRATPIPEPSTFVLATLGLVALAVRSKRFKKSPNGKPQ